LQSITGLNSSTRPDGGKGRAIDAAKPQAPSWLAPSIRSALRQSAAVESCPSSPLPAGSAGRLAPRSLKWTIPVHHTSGTIGDTTMRILVSDALSEDGIAILKENGFTVDNL